MVVAMVALLVVIAACGVAALGLLVETVIDERRERRHQP